MEDIILSKYGGSSLANAGDIERVARITEEDPHRAYIVVSAPGDEKKENKVTSRLIHLASLRGNETAAKEDIDFIVAKYEALYPGKGGYVADEIRKLDRDQSLEPEWYAAQLRALGEELQGKLLAETLGYQFVNFRTFMKLSEDADNAKVLPETYKLLTSIERDGQKIVFPGYGGITNNGKITTLGRDGTNISASVIAAALGVRVYENFSDSPVLAADPNIVPDAVKIEEMTYDEIRDLSCSGFSIFHREAIQPLLGTGIPIHLRATHLFPQTGTMIVEDRASDIKLPVIGIAYEKEYAVFNVRNLGLNDILGAVHLLTGVFYSRKISLEHVNTETDGIALVVKQNLVKKDVSTIKAELASSIETELRNVEFIENLGCVAVSGKGLQRDPRISAKIEIALDKAKIPHVTRCGGTEKRTFIYVVEERYGHKAVRALYDRFIRK